MEQIERTRRYLERLRQIYVGVPYMDKTRKYYTDDVHSFFIHCFHIRDWIVQLNILGLTRADVDAFINSHAELQICADLSNGVKHCRLTQNRRTGNQPHIAVTEFESDGINDEYHTTRGKFMVLSNGKFFDALELAETCMKLWDEYIAGLVLTARHPDRHDAPA